MKGSLFCTFLRAVFPSPSRLTPAENPSLLPEWLELFEKPPGPLGPSPCPGEGSRSLQLTCSAEELTNDQGDRQKIKMTQNKKLNLQIKSEWTVLELEQQNKHLCF